MMNVRVAQGRTGSTGLRSFWQRRKVSSLCGDGMRLVLLRAARALGDLAFRTVRSAPVYCPLMALIGEFERDPRLRHRCLRAARPRIHKASGGPSAFCALIWTELSAVT